MRFRMAALLLAICCLLAGCSVEPSLSDAQGTQAPSPTASASATPSPAPVEDAVQASEIFTDRDYEVGFDESNAAKITLQGTTASTTSDAVEIRGSTIIIRDEGTYIITGTMTDGRIVVDAGAKDKPQLIFLNASVTSSTSAALYILSADKVFVTLAEGSENTLGNGGEFVAVDENNIDGAVFAKQDLTINGDGTLTVTSPAGHGIVCKDELALTGGTIRVTAAAHALDANDSVAISNAVLRLVAGKDGIHAENSDDTTLGSVYITGGSFEIKAEGDGISAGADLQINGGTLDIVAGGGSENAASSGSSDWGKYPGGMGQSVDSGDDSTSMKGMKCVGNMHISGGTFRIDSADDAVHANTSIRVSKGSFEIATGDDGFHADETLTVLGGTVNIRESYEGLEALEVVVSGGDITLKASDDGINAAGGTDASGMGGMRPGGDRFGGPGGMGRAGGSSATTGSILISGGKIAITAYGDGIDANGSLSITGGYTTVTGPTQGDTATLDYDTTGVISGGTFLGTGASGMAQTFSSSENQGVLAVSVGQQSAGTEVRVTDGDGKVLVSFNPQLPYAVVIVSTPQLRKGEAYTVTVGDASAELTAS